jgi:hypothetical protein
MQQRNARVAARKRNQKPKKTAMEDKPKQSIPTHLIQADKKPNPQSPAVTPILIPAGAPELKLQGKSPTVQKSGPHKPLIITPPHLL